MIRFIPVHHDGITWFNDAEKFVANLGNGNIANQLNKKLEGNSCPSHPDYENKISVDINLPEEKWLTVQNYCCASFKERLQMICDNKVPADFVR